MLKFRIHKQKKQDKKYCLVEGIQLLFSHKQLAMAVYFCNSESCSCNLKAIFKDSKLPEEIERRTFSFLSALHFCVDLSCLRTLLFEDAGYQSLELFIYFMRGLEPTF